MGRKRLEGMSLLVVLQGRCHSLSLKAPATDGFLPGRRFLKRVPPGLYDRYGGDDQKQVEELEDVVLKAEIALQIYGLRTKAGLSQRELAKRVGTSASAICRLEDADCEGHSLLLLKRIADALDRKSRNSICACEAATHGIDRGVVRVILGLVRVSRLDVRLDVACVFCDWCGCSCHYAQSPKIWSFGLGLCLRSVVDSQVGG